MGRMLSLASSVGYFQSARGESGAQIKAWRKGARPEGGQMGAQMIGAPKVHRAVHYWRPIGGALCCVL